MKEEERGKEREKERRERMDCMMVVKLTSKSQSPARRRSSYSPQHRYRQQQYSSNTTKSHQIMDYSLRLLRTSLGLQIICLIYILCGCGSSSRLAIVISQYVKKKKIPILTSLEIAMQIPLEDFITTNSIIFIFALREALED